MSNGDRCKERNFERENRILQSLHGNFPSGKEAARLKQQEVGIILVSKPDLAHVVALWGTFSLFMLVTKPEHVTAAQ